MNNDASKDLDNKKRNSECLSDYDSISSKISKIKQNMNKKWNSEYLSDDDSISSKKAKQKNI